jgi:hypothetical protein
MENKTVELKQLLDSYRDSNHFYSDCAELLNQPCQKCKLVAVAIADYILRCQHFDPKIIDMIVDRSSGPV